tara:strand:- start:1640 stop:2173 length:534 start_codon:yes stop_codon:yes gene_type:complete
MADKKIVLKNVEVSWAKLHEPTTKWKSTDLHYSVDVKVNEQIENLMKEYDLNKTFKSKDSTFDGADFIKITADEKTRTGWTRYGEVFSKSGEPTKDLVGNGSKMNLFVSIGKGDHGNNIKLGHLEDLDRDNKGLFFYFGQVMELVDYEKPSAVLRSEQTKSAVEKAPEEELSIALED